MNQPIDITDVRLMTKHLLLRPFRESDLQDFNAYASVDGVGQSAGWKPHTSIEESEKILHTFIEEGNTFAIVKQGKVIGSLGIKRYDEMELREFMYQYGRELGFVLSKDYWGLGLMKEAIDAVLKYLFEVQDLDFVVCGHFKSNERSRNLQLKCGFHPYKEVLLNMPVADNIPSMINIMYKEDWEKNQ